MWIVFDIDAKPGAVRSANEDGEPVIVDTVEEAVRFLGERIQFTLGYMADPDGDAPAPPLPTEISERLSTFVGDHARAPGRHTFLRYDSEDGYAHIAVLVSALAGTGFRTGMVVL